MPSRACEPARIVGLLVGSDETISIPILKIRARAAPGQAVLGETCSAPDGQFVLELPLSGAPGSEFRLPLQVEVLDGCDSLIAETSLDIAAGEQLGLTLTLPGSIESCPAASELAAAPALVNAQAAAVLRERVRAWIERGALAPAALQMLEVILQPLEWVDSLLPEAQAALRGDSAAGERLRIALLAWSSSAPEDEPVEELHEAHVADAPLELVNSTGLLPLALSAIYISRDAREAQALLDGLAAVVWMRPWLDLLAAAARQENPMPMQTLMGAMPGNIPDLPGGGLPGGGWPGGGWPGGGLGKLPGKKTKIPGVRVGPTVADLVPYFRNPENLKPTERELCLVGALVEVARIKERLPRYAIRAYDNPNACPGQLLTISGENFGPSGLVRFPGTSKPVAALTWSDTFIQVIVPTGAAPGKLTLSIYEMRLRRCEQDFDIYRLGDTFAEFNGGLPQILSLWVDSSSSDTSAEPNSDVSIWFETSQSASVLAALIITDSAGGVIFQTGPLAGGVHSLTFHTPPITTAPLDLRVTVRAVGVCGTVERALTLTITHQPRLRILQYEITQGIQRLDNSVRLAANHSTLLRLYLDNGLGSFPGFSYTANPHELPGVTGSVTIYRGSQKLAEVAPNPAVITSTFFFQPGGRQGLNLSLNFMLPVQHLSGPLRFEVRVWLAAPPHGVIDGPHTRDVRAVYPNFERTNHMRMVRVMLRDDWRMLPAPPDGAFFSALQAARSRLPLPDDGYEIFLPPGSPVIGTNHDLTTSDGWEFVLEDLDDIAEDTSNAWNYAWVGIIAAQTPGGPNLKLNGIGRKGNGEHDFPAMACQAGLMATFAHELVHVFGFGHAGCPASGDGAPENIDASLPPYIEDYAVDLSTGQIFSPGFTGSGELMSYCTGESRWPSIVLWHKLMDLLKV